MRTLRQTPVRVGRCTCEVVTDGNRFLGLGQIWIGNTLVRSGRLPLSPYFETFSGRQLARLVLRGVETRRDRVVIKLAAEFTMRPVAWLRDHSFDPIHDTTDWAGQRVAGRGELRLVLKPARENVGGARFEGFSYHYEYDADDKGGALFWIMDRASWELDGNILGATAISQSSCSAPQATFAKNTEWSTEGLLHFLVESGNANPVMTHNLPRFASHGSFDFQYKGSKTLIGVFERVGLIRSLVKREAGQRELKHFDKHIFDETTRARTVAKKILLNTDRKTVTDQRNLWTWLFDLVHDRARAEFGLKEEPVLPRLVVNYWVNFTINKYFKDLLPAAVNIGIKQLFIDNVNKSDMTEGTDQITGGNMCCGHEYEPAPKLGGARALKRFVARCRAHGIQPMSWTNNDQSYTSPLNHARTGKSDWFVKMEDTRLKYGGSYTNVFTILDFKQEAPRRYWIDCLKKIKRQTGLNGYLFDSFYNLGFMPVNFAKGRPATMWRELLQAMKELQDAGVHFLIESFGPFGQVQHGCPSSYNVENLFACYKIGLGNDYTTMPTNVPVKDTTPGNAALLFYILAHKASLALPLFVKGERIDKVWTPEQKRVLADYHKLQAQMHRRFLQADGQSVLWHDATGKRATLWNFVERTVALPGRVTDATTGRELPRAEKYRLEANHAYVIRAAALPVSPNPA